MILPVQIAFRNMKPSAAVEERVRKEVAKLETFYSDISSCRVVVEIPHRRHRRGVPYHVRIDMIVPGGELVVKRTPTLHTALRQVDSERELKSHKTDANQKDVFVVIRDAFNEARRRLQDFAHRERRQTKIHVPQATGRVCKLFPEKGYGFLETPDGTEIYFHKNSVLNDAFDRLTVGANVRFSEEMGEKGAQASTVRALG
jgi:cold shock CspA family protein